MHLHLQVSSPIDCPVNLHHRIQPAAVIIAAGLIALHATPLLFVGLHSSLAFVLKALLVLVPCCTLICNDDVNSALQSAAVFSAKCVWKRLLPVAHCCFGFTQMCMWIVCVACVTASFLCHLSTAFLDGPMQLSPYLHLITATLHLAVYASHALPMNLSQRHRLLSIGDFVASTELLDSALTACYAAQLDTYNVISFTLVFTIGTATFRMPSCGSCVLCAVGDVFSCTTTILQLCLASHVSTHGYVRLFTRCAGRRGLRRTTLAAVCVPAVVNHCRPLLILQRYKLSCSIMLLSDLLASACARMRFWKAV